MPNSIRFVLALHNHQPIGNFHGVIEQAYQESYRPFLDVLVNYPQVKISLHTSGCLLEWLDAHHPEYVDRLAELASTGQIEIIGGAFEEPILPMIPSRDRIGQIRRYSRWLERRLGTSVRGAWIPERVWEQCLASDLATAGVEYTVLDDFHFRNAGLTDEQLVGYYLTEDDGQLLKVFPGSEKLRYVIPFGSPQETIDYLARIAAAHPNAVAVCGDDGEKFGTWPQTHQHVYVDGWLTRFFDALLANRDWIEITTLAEAVDHTPPLGKIYLPDSSYREMTEWALPAEQIAAYDQVVHEMEHDGRWQVLKRFVRGGFWRNFKVKYPESDEMYTRMLMVSERLAAAEDAANGKAELINTARDELYRGQCNCGYWHGAFGGIYLPHLRNAVYQHLISADNLLNEATGRHGAWVEANSGDYNLDARQELQLANDKLLALLAPARGGMLYELDVRSICHNLLATLSRRPEAYHRKVLAGAARGSEHVASIHDRVIFKQPGLDQRLQYDTYPRKSLIDHFYDPALDPLALAAGQAGELGDFVGGVYESRIRRGRDRVQVVLSRSGHVGQQPIQLTKTITLEAGSPELEIGYLVENLPEGRELLFAPEFNFAGLPAGADDRYFFDVPGQHLGQLGTRLDLDDLPGLGLADEWLGISVLLRASQPTRFWTHPVETVSQSEGGFELVHQSVAVFPHWLIRADHQRRFAVTLRLAIDTSRAESRHPIRRAEVVTS